MRRLRDPEKIKAQKRAYYLRNKEKVLAASRAYEAAHPEEVKARRKTYRIRNAEALKQKKREYYLANSEAINKQSVEWGRANKERRREISREWARANPEKRRETIKSYYENNPEKFAADVKARRARLGEGPPDEVVERLLRGRICYYCGVGLHNEPRVRGQRIHPCKATVDHMVPLARTPEGADPNEESNLVTSCYACNLSKGKKTAEEYFAFLARRRAP